MDHGSQKKVSDVLKECKIDKEIKVLKLKDTKLVKEFKV